MFTTNAGIQEWLERFLDAHQGVAGTVHLERGGDLHLAAAKNIPPPVIAAVTLVPHGKGMAGIAQESRKPAQSCNLKTDTSGTVKPGARAVDAQAAIALPVLDAAGQVLAVVGIAFAEDGAIAPDRERALMDAAAALPL
jgi:L-methionine (R)-S-oxide reductase